MSTRSPQYGRTGSRERRPAATDAITDKSSTHANLSRAKPQPTLREEHHRKINDK